MATATIPVASTHTATAIAPGAPVVDAPARPRKLGRGLGALIGEPVAVPNVAQATNEVARATSETGALPPLPAPGTPAPRSAPSEAPSAHGDGRRLLLVGVDDIDPSPFQAREVFSPDALRELADSIRAAGVMQPVIVRPLKAERGAPARYELIAGERRWRAARLAGLPAVPAVLATLTDEESAQWGLIENVQRQDLGALEKARAFARLADRFGLSHEQIARKVGVDRASVANHIRLLDLEPGTLDLLQSGALGFGHARALLAMPPGEARAALARTIAQQGWSVRRVERHVAEALEQQKAAGGAAAPRARRAPHSADLALIEKQIGERLGTRVRIRARDDGRKGRLVIDYYSLDQFDGLMERMGVQLEL